MQGFASDHFLFNVPLLDRFDDFLGLITNPEMVKIFLRDELPRQDGIPEPV